MSQDEYVKVICDQLEIIQYRHPSNYRRCTERYVDWSMWSLNKWEVLNAIETEMRRRGSVQGCRAVKQEFKNEKTTWDGTWFFLAEVVTKEDIVVDATMGNGHDTLFFSQLAKQVYAFDIQEQALEKTQERLDQAGMTNAQLILKGHETLDQFVTEAKAGIFNLGYLPSADKSVITQPQTTIKALEKLCHLLVKGGRIAIMIYYGHEGGDTERMLYWILLASWTNKSIQLPFIGLSTKLIIHRF